jgi:hypothetical protein
MSVGRAREDSTKDERDRRQNACWVPVHGTPFVDQNMPYWNAVRDGRFMDVV